MVKDAERRHALSGEHSLVLLASSESGSGPLRHLPPHWVAGDGEEDRQRGPDLYPSPSRGQAFTPSTHLC